MTDQLSLEDRRRIVREIFAQTIQLHERVMHLDPTPLLAAVDAMEAAFAGGGKVLAFGNGGSAADAQHFAAELVNRFTRERQALPALALTTDTSVLTSVANDYRYERVFARQVEAFGRAGDLALGISTSGEAASVLAAFAAARARGVTTVALTGRNGGRIGKAADIHINVPDGSTARVQEVHRTLLHVMCELIERGLAGG